MESVTVRVTAIRSVGATPFFSQAVVGLDGQLEHRVDFDLPFSPHGESAHLTVSVGGNDAAVEDWCASVGSSWSSTNGHHGVRVVLRKVRGGERAARYGAACAGCGEYNEYAEVSVGWRCFSCRRTA